MLSLRFRHVEVVVEAVRHRHHREVRVEIVAEEVEERPSRQYSCLAVASCRKRPMFSKNVGRMVRHDNRGV